jgi:hypothetical protein
VEQDALMRIYQLNTKTGFGAHVRTEATWQWLFNRRAFDQIYVALEGTEKIALGESLHSIIGYAVVKAGRVIELMVDEGREDARNQLLQRICSDVIEHQDKHVTIDARVDDTGSQRIQSSKLALVNCIHHRILHRGGANQGNRPPGGDRGGYSHNCRTLGRPKIGGHSPPHHRGHHLHLL